MSFLWFAIAAAAGVIGAGILFSIRRASWRAAIGLGWIGAALAAIGVAVVLWTLWSSNRQGGDASMAAIVLALYGGAAVGAGTLAAVLISLVQARALGHPIQPNSFLVGIPDPLLMAFGIWCSLSVVHALVEKPVTDDWQQKELARREQRRQELKAIPPPYRDRIPEVLRQIDEERRFRRDAGLPEVDSIPRDIENRMRNYWNQTGMPHSETPIDRTGYRRAREARTGMILGLPVGWMAGALVLPFLWRRPRLP